MVPVSNMLVMERMLIAMVSCPIIEPQHETFNCGSISSHQQKQFFESGRI